MTQCWSEGALRAYLDRELPTADMQTVAAHLGDCTVCDGLCTELAARATHVSALMELLPEWGAAVSRPAIAARRRPQRPNWIGIAVALAACLALAAYLLPNRQPPQEALVLPARTIAPAPAPLAVAVAAMTPALAVQPVPRRPRRVRQTAP